MEIVGFIFSALLLLYITVALVVGVPCVCALGGGMRRVYMFWYLPALASVGYLWYLLFRFAPFTLNAA